MTCQVDDCLTQASAASHRLPACAADATQEAEAVLWLVGGVGGAVELELAGCSRWAAQAATRCRPSASASLTLATSPGSLVCSPPAAPPHRRAVDSSSASRTRPWSARDRSGTGCRLIRSAVGGRMRSLAHSHAVDEKQVRGVVHAVLMGGGTRAFRAKYKERGREPRRRHQEDGHGEAGAGSSGAAARCGGLADGRASSW